MALLLPPFFLISAQGAFAEDKRVGEIRRALITGEPMAKILKLAEVRGLSVEDTGRVLLGSGAPANNYIYIAAVEGYNIGEIVSAAILEGVPFEQIYRTAVNAGADGDEVAIAAVELGANPDDVSHVVAAESTVKSFRP